MTLLEPIQATPAYAENAFGFLSELGFHLQERWISGGQSFRDGWRLTYASHAVQVVVEYLDMELEVSFIRSDVSLEYWSIDRDLFGRRSGFHGKMFPPRKLATALDRVSADVRGNYAQLLSGDETTWSRTVKSLDMVKPKSRLP